MWSEGSGCAEGRKGVFRWAVLKGRIKAAEQKIKNKTASEEEQRNTLEELQ